MVWVLVLLRVTVNWAVSPSSTVASMMLSRGSVAVTVPSSSVMVPVAVPSWMVAPPGLLRVTVKVSVCSSVVSSTVGTEIVLDALAGSRTGQRLPRCAV